MPRKSKRSLSASRRWKKDIQHEPAKKSESEVKVMSPDSSAIQEQSADQCQTKIIKPLFVQSPAEVTPDVNTIGSVESSKAQTSTHSCLTQSPALYQVNTNANLNKGVTSSMLQPSIQSEPDEVCVSSSHAQNTNTQCTANAAVFLAFLHENENLCTSDLDLVLDRGDQLYYKMIPKGKDVLAAEELNGEVVEGNTDKHTILLQASMCGLLRDCHIPEFPALKDRLHCLFHDAQYALLIVRLLQCFEIIVANLDFSIFIQDSQMVFLVVLRRS